MGKKLLAPGFRFHPTDVELVKYYLKRKVLGKKLHFPAISEVDIYKFAPWDLPEKSCLRNGDLKWYFFCPRGKKYSNGCRLNRATDFGYWKTTGKDRHVYSRNECAGMIKTLVFHRGKAPKGERTDWVIHEYRLEEKELAEKGVVQDAYALCVLFKKDGWGPRNGSQYGAPFKEEDWDSDKDDEEMNGGDASSADMSASELLPSVSDIVVAPVEAPQVLYEDDEIPEMRAMFSDSRFIVNENENIEEVPILNNSGDVVDDLHSNEYDMYDSLADLGTLDESGSHFVNCYSADYTMSTLDELGSHLFGCSNADYTMDQTLQGDHFELIDVAEPLF